MSDRRRAGRPDAAGRLAIEERRHQVAALIHAGVSYRRIAVMVDCGLATVASDAAAIKEQWRARYAREYDEHVAEELAGLEALRHRWFPVALGHGEDAVVATQLLIRIDERLHRLMGSDRPTRVETAVTVATTSKLDEEIAGLLAQFHEHAEQ